MVSLYAVVSLLILYGISQFLIARWGESRSVLARKFKRSPTTYALSLAVYCTAWTYYGNVGQASTQGISHISLFFGSTLAFVFFTPLFKRMVRIKQAYHSTSIADFISTRYNNSQFLAALITSLCLLGIIPYISIQLKAVITSFQVLVTYSSNSLPIILPYLDIIVVVLMSVFTIAFGVRRLDPTERHSGMMLALASESLFKLFGFLVASFFICFVIFNGLSDVFNQVSANISQDSRFAVFSQPPAISHWLASMTLGIVGVVALPRQFHVGIIECSHESQLDRARWLFPLYLLLINVMVLPIAMAGTILFPEANSADLVMIEIPASYDHSMVAILVFLGGFAAATGMIIVSIMTLSTMTTNHIVIPIIEYIPRLQFFRRYILYMRWVAVIFLLLWGALYYRLIGDSAMIVKIGSISFVAIAQLLPALIGGILWSKGRLIGAIAGITSGTVIWLYTSLLPSIIHSGWVNTKVLSQGAFGQLWLRPEQLFGLPIESTVGHSLFWSLLVNICLYVLLSEYKQETDVEVLKHSEKFILVGAGQESSHYQSQNIIANIVLEQKLRLLSQLVNRYLPKDKADKKLVSCCTKCHLNGKISIDVFQLSQLKSQVTHMLAGIIGMAASNRAIQSIELFNDQEKQQLNSAYSDILAKSQLSPEELLQKVDFYQEKRDLLQDHANMQAQTIQQLKDEQQQTALAKQQLRELNDNLEKRVYSRTEQLSNANIELNIALDELEQAQAKLVEADKMASLGGLVAGIAHEVNTPIGVVLTALTTLEEEYQRFKKFYDEENVSKQCMEDFLSYVADISQLSLNNIKRAVTLVESFKQVAVDQTSEECRAFNVKDYIQHILLSLEPKLSKTAITVHIHCPADLIITSYPGALSQILSNFILNSILHAFEPMQKGNIFINVELEESQINLNYADDGRGLTEDEKQNIFEPFFTTKRGSGGSGLGAHIAYNITTQLLKGEIAIDRDKSDGVSIHITFPIN